MKLLQTIIYSAALTCSIFLNPIGVCAMKEEGFRNNSSSWYFGLQSFGIKCNEDNKIAHPEKIYRFGLGIEQACLDID